MEKKFKRDIRTLDEVFAFIDQYSADQAIDGSALYAVRFVVEELFTNFVKYNSSPTCAEISLSLEKRENLLIITLVDYDVEPFDITNVHEPDPGQPLQERKIGGLGLHLVKRMADSIQYEYKDRRSTITVMKHLE